MFSEIIHSFVFTSDIMRGRAPYHAHIWDISIIIIVQLA